MFFRASGLALMALENYEAMAKKINDNGWKDCWKPVTSVNMERIIA